MKVSRLLIGFAIGWLISATWLNSPIENWEVVVVVVMLCLALIVQVFRE